MPGDAVDQLPVGVTLSIGDLAERTGLTPSALRMWEQRYGFPIPHRLAGGHRRYTTHDVEQVRDVVRRRDAGVRLEQAIDDVRRRAAPTTPSVFATLRDLHPHLEVSRMHKSTLLAMSWAIEDQVVALADRAVLWGAFQKASFYKPATSRWRELARSNAGVTVFADFEQSDLTTTPRRVALTPDAPMVREWAVVVDSFAFPVALTAWELPGQEDVADRGRVFETMWTLDAAAVRDAARVCAEVARSVDPSAAQGQYAPPPPLDPQDQRPPSLARVSGMMTRMAAYVDRWAPVDREAPGAGRPPG